MKYIPIRFKLLSSLLFIAFVSCQKELHFPDIDQSGAAIYSLDGAPTACTNPVINGSYYAGIALNNTNTVLITANVTTPGTYSISTNTINGINFTGSGTFTSTGPQSITLAGTGIPTAAIQSSYVPGPNGCSFIINVISDPVAAEPLYWEATIDGVYHREEVDDINYGYAWGVEYSPSGHDTIGLSTSIDNIVSTSGILTKTFEINKQAIHNYTTLTHPEFRDFLSVNSYPYTPPGIDSTTNGIRINWVDSTGHSWSTNLGSGDQSGSNFNIINTEDYHNTLNWNYRVSITFNCKLYDSTGNMKTFTNGTYVGVFGKFL